MSLAQTPTLASTISCFIDEASGLDFIDAAARLAAAVAIVAGQDQAGPFGLVVSSMTILSVKPPRILFCVRKASSSYERLLACDRLSLSVLKAEDEREAALFSRADRVGPRFDAGRWSVPADGAPHFEGALLAIEGGVFQRISAASHTIFILNVEGAQLSEGQPLLYFDRRYRRLAEPALGASRAPVAA